MVALTKPQMQEVVDANFQFGQKTEAAKYLKMPVSTFKSRLSQAIEKNIVPSPGIVDEFGQTVDKQLEEARAKIRALESAIATHKREELDQTYVKRQILNLAEHDSNPPPWLVTPTKSKKGIVTGVPTLFASDWHWGEIVDPNQINGVNSYDIGIAQGRARLLIQKTIELLSNNISPPNYPGIVFALGGDMVSGDIHEELVATNQKEIMPVVVDLFGVLTWCIETLADHFGQVFVPCVSGNHGRNTVKIRAKGRAFTSFDWLLYQFLAKEFENDKRIKFMIPDGPDALYTIYNHRYLLTHGDQFRGGDGMIGALGPIIRGDHRKRSRNGQIDLEYDCLLLGHWHQLIHLERLIVNGSLVGYSEYAYNSNFPFEAPRQALWITHPDHGITFSLPIRVDDQKTDNQDKDWVGWKCS